MNEITITRFLSAFFSNKEKVILRVMPGKRVMDRGGFFFTNLEELKKEASIKEHLMKDNKTKDVCFYPHSGAVHLSKITRYNAFFIELSRLSFTAHHQILNDAPIPPSIRVENKISICAFWLIEGKCSQSDWMNVQNRLTAYFKDGRENKNPTRLFRLPLFNQVTCNGRRCAPKKVEVTVFNTSRRFTAEQMKNAFTLPETDVEAKVKTEIQTKSENIKAVVESSEIKAVEEITVEEKKNSSNSCNSSFVSTETDSFPILSDKALYGLAGEIVTEIANDSESHPAALLIQFLAAFGNIVGFSPHFYTEADAQGINLYTVVVGKSARSGRKGTSWGNISALFSMVEPTWAVENLQSGGLSSGEGLITRLRDANGDDPGVGDKRLLVVEGEFASVLRVKGRETNTLDAILRNAWDRKPLSKMISSKTDSMKVTDPHFSFIGHITEEELKSLIKDVDAYNGYSNRILWVCTKRTKKLPRGGRFFKRDITNYILSLRDIINVASAVKEMDFDNEANDLWTEFYLSLNDKETGKPASVLSRAEPQVIRLAMLYALLDKSNIVRKVHLEAALGLWQYCEDSVRYIFGESLSAGASKLLEALREAGGKGLSRSDIIANVFNKNKSKADIDSWLAELRNLIVFDDDKKLYFSKESSETNDEFNEFDEFDEPKVAVKDSNQSNSNDMGVKP